MRENKVLAVAIASALSIGTGAVQAGKLILLDPQNGGTSTSSNATSTPVYATEFFPATGTTEVIPQALPGKGATGYSGPNGTPRYHVQYDFENDAIGDELETPFEIQFSLNNGATWGAEVNAALMTTGDVRLISEETLAPYASAPEISKAAGGNPTDSTVTFLIQANEINNLPKSAIFEFVFDMDDLNALNTRGNTIDLTVEPRANVGTSVIAVDTIQSIPIAQSEEGVQVAILPDTTPGDIAIDVSTGATLFTPVTQPSETSVILGNIQIVAGGDSDARDVDGTSAYAFDGGTGGSFTITSGIFCASSANPDATNQVYIDINNNEELDADDLAASTVNQDSATWQFTQTDIAALADGEKHNIIVAVDGSSTICEQPQAPQATLVVNYQTGESVYSGKLRHIKRNGTICTLYNIPSPGAGVTDALSVRLTNKSTTDATVTATLRPKSGLPYICQNFDLLVNLGGTIAPNATVRLGQDELRDAANADPDCSVTEWTGRAVLIISSDVPSMEMYGLLRNKLGGPLLNLSLGATGNGCDD